MNIYVGESYEKAAEWAQHVIDVAAETKQTRIAMAHLKLLQEVMDQTGAPYAGPPFEYGLRLDNVGPIVSKRYGEEDIVMGRPSSQEVQAVLAEDHNPLSRFDADTYVGLSYESAANRYKEILDLAPKQERPGPELVHLYFLNEAMKVMYRKKIDIITEDMAKTLIEKMRHIDLL